MPASVLPIAAALPALARALSAGSSAVLQAPPGAGKTTGVPLALLDAPWLEGRTIVMLEPRRLAARAAAHFMARKLGERVGETVGYRVRMDSRVGPRTRIEVVTEGVLTRLLLADPALERVGLVIFDEFHERNLPGDVGLALALQSQELLRPELRLLVMSATLDGTAVSRLMGDAPVIASEGRAYPVETRWRPSRPDDRLERAVAATVREALAGEPGDVLVFLPGQGEIHRVAARLADAPLPAGVRVHPLYGALAVSAQDAAIAPSAPGTRKVVLATAIAETSLTIEGVRVVVDAGLARLPRFSPRTGMTRLETVRVSRASADQRRGRAGRVAPGVCYRLWSEAEEAHLPAHTPPEIADADLAPLALELAEAGVTDPRTLRWLDPPPAAAYARARELLVELGALRAPDGGDAVASGRITAHGRRMAALALHPRLAHMLLRGVELGHGGVACDLAALLGERDVLRADDAGGGAAVDADLRLRLELLGDRDALSDSGYARGLRVDGDALRRVREQARQWRRQSGARDAERATGDVDVAGLLLALAYPDRIARRRPGAGGRYLLRNGSGAAFAGPQPLASLPWLVVAELDGRQPAARIFLAAPVELDELETHHADQIETVELVEWDDDAQVVRARRVRRLGAIVLREAPLRDPEPALVAAALLDVVRRRGLESLPWNRHATQLRQRLRFLHGLDPAAWPDASDAALLATMGDWLAPALHDLRRWDEVQRLSLTDALMTMLPWDRRAALDALAPTHYTVPGGPRVALDYSDPAAPVLAVRLQELFGVAETPRIAAGTVPLTLHLLSPARRPMQITRDLAGFWRTSYFDVRREMRGRYPKHDWPDEPWTRSR
ncbi:MAG: ATP-dependent helicase HrpB [Gemmatimonadaceae bacterium]